LLDAGEPFAFEHFKLDRRGNSGSRSTWRKMSSTAGSVRACLIEKLTPGGSCGPATGLPGAAPAATGPSRPVSLSEFIPAKLLVAEFCVHAASVEQKSLRLIQNPFKLFSSP